MEADAQAEVQAEMEAEPRAEIEAEVKTEAAAETTESLAEPSDAAAGLFEDAAVDVLDAALVAFTPLPQERPALPAPIPGFDELSAPFAEASEPVDTPCPPSSPSAETDASRDWATVQGGAVAAVERRAEAVERQAEAGLPRGATESSDSLAERDAELQAFVARETAQAHVAETLEAVARRVRSGEIVPVTEAGASVESVLASVLASLLASRP